MLMPKAIIVMNAFNILSFVLKVPRPVLLLQYNSGFFDVSNLYISLL